jgi:hypothetical protein
LPPQDRHGEYGRQAWDRLREDTITYGVYGGQARRMGRFWTTVNPETTPYMRAGLGLPDDNTCQRCVVGRMKRDFAGVSGPAAPFKSETYGVTWPGGYPEYVFGSPGEAAVQIDVLRDFSLNPPC